MDKQLMLRRNKSPVYVSNAIFFCSQFCCWVLSVPLIVWQAHPWVGGGILSFLDSCGTLQSSFCVARACCILNVYLDGLCHLRTMQWLEPVLANVQLWTNYSQFWLLYKLVLGEERAAFYLLNELGCVEFCIRIHVSLAIAESFSRRESGKQTSRALQMITRLLSRSCPYLPSPAWQCCNAF